MLLLSSLVVSRLAGAEPATPPALPTLTVKGANYINAEGETVRFWGMNLVAAYPEHARADAIAKNLANIGINLARPHHLLRPGKDWNPDLPSAALLSYQGNSREFEPIALDRFDYLNAALKKRGVYLAFSAHFTRAYLTGDVDVLKTDDDDRNAWMSALAEMNGWPSKQSFDLRKLLPVVDERAALLNEEFVRNLLNHRNPYTGLTYAEDQQVIAFEMVNEHALEYAIICQNRLPDYWQKRLEKRWHDYAAAAGVDGGDIYKPSTPEAVALREKFLTGLDEAYFLRIGKVIRATGSAAPLTYSNLWRGDSTLEMHARLAEIMENHGYIDPLVTRNLKDGLADIGRTALAGKPFFVGEFNQAEGERNIRAQSPFRTMLPLAAAAYGDFNAWSGIVWFAWNHGKNVKIGDDGWAIEEGREANLGGMVADGMIIDHMRTAGMIFRRGLVAASSQPVTVWTEGPFAARTYQDLMRGKDTIEDGWHGVHAIRRAYGPVPAGQASAPWMTAKTTSPVTSDTGEIVKDLARRQLTVAAPRAEGFSGYLDNQSPAGLKHLEVAAAAFATVIAVADEDQNLGQAGHIIVSRTGLDAANQEINGPVVTLRGLSGDQWNFIVTRPRSRAGKMIELQAMNGVVTLPTENWHEGELTRQ